MDFYELTIYVSVEQELAIRELFVYKGWHLNKKEGCDAETPVESKCEDRHETWPTCRTRSAESTEHTAPSVNTEGTDNDGINSSPHDTEICSDLQGFVEATLNDANVDDEIPTGAEFAELNVFDGTLDCKNSSVMDSDDENDSDDAHNDDDEVTYTKHGVAVNEDSGVSDEVINRNKDCFDSHDVEFNSNSCQFTSACLSKSDLSATTAGNDVKTLKHTALRNIPAISGNRSNLTVKKVNKVGTFYCEDCDHTYHLLGAYKNHKRKGKCRFECEHCGKIFTSRYYSNYKYHLKNHSHDRHHVCSVCGRSYSNLHTLNIHMRTHSGVRPYMCQHCGRQFYSSSHLLRHETKMHSKPQEKYQCNTCHAELSSPGNLRVHQNVVHMKERPFTCEICGKSFKTRKTLEQVHAKVHLNVYPYICDYSGCGKKFKRSGSYTEHVRRHSNQRSHFCKNCGKGFYTKKDMMLHTRIHSGEKPYQCDLCEYKCALQGNLQKHLKTHVT